MRDGTKQALNLSTDAMRVCFNLLYRHNVTHLGFEARVPNHGGAAAQKNNRAVPGTC